MPILLKNIRKELRSFGVDSRSYTNKKRPILKHTPNALVGVKSVIHKFIVKGEKTKYMTHVQFFDIEFSKEKKEGWIPINVSGKLFYYKVPSVRKNAVNLKCSCEAMRYKFERELAKNKGLIGNWRRYDAEKEDKKNGVPSSIRKETKYHMVRHPQGGSYKRKTQKPPKGREFNNPDGYVGYCKHVHSVLRYLHNANLLKE